MLILSSTRFWHFSRFSNNITSLLLHKKEVRLYLKISTQQHTTSVCLMLTTSCLNRPHPWCLPFQYPSSYARCKPQPSWRRLRTPNSHSLCTQQTMRWRAHCLHPPLHPHRQVNVTYTLRVTEADPKCSLNPRAHHKSLPSRETSWCHSHRLPLIHQHTHASVAATNTNPAPAQLFLVWWTIRPLNAWTSSPQLNLLLQSSWTTTTITTIGVSTTSDAYLAHSTKCPITQIWVKNCTTKTSANLSSSSSIRSTHIYW